MSEPAAAPSPLIPIPRGPVPEAPPARARPQVEIRIDGKSASVPEGATILDAARSLGIDTPTLCYLDTLTPVNVCRVCVVELDGSRTLVPACSRKAWKRIFGQLASIARSSGAYSTSTVGASTAS